MSFSEIGKRMGISRSRVEQLFIRAIKKLRVEMLKPEYDDIRQDLGAWVCNLAPDTPVRDRPQCGKKPGPKPKTRLARRAKPCPLTGSGVINHRR